VLSELHLASCPYHGVMPQISHLSRVWLLSTYFATRDPAARIKDAVPSPLFGAGSRSIGVAYVAHGERKRTEIALNTQQ
jgi:hypothetical protein